MYYIFFIKFVKVILTYLYTSPLFGFILQSGNDRTGRSNRLGSISSLSSEAPSMSVRLKSTTSENGELDYKKLYEESQAENERLKEKLRRSDEQLKEARNLLDKAQSAQNKTVLSETEKRERRAMERKLSEMEEELKVKIKDFYFTF